MKNLSDFLHRLMDNEHFSSRAFNLTPSENILSPLARLPFSLDIYSRYFLDDLRLFGRWFFPSGESAGDIEQELLLPLMRNLAQAAHVNVRPVSGINCMTVALAGLTKSGDTVLTVPPQVGGHASTAVVAQRLGLQVEALPFRNAYDIDLAQLAAILERSHPTLIYLDQSTFLFPIDPAPVRSLVDELSPMTLIHYDSSHLNGLILTGSIPNPLQRGAHTFGGSTHKTLPGPHKGFMATNDQLLAKRIQDATDHFVSHPHMADVASLAITLFELQECDGKIYAERVLDNAKLFAATLAGAGIDCAAAERGWTDSHQVWAVPAPNLAIDESVRRLKRCHIIANNFNQLPGVPHPAYRLSSAEFTRLGATEKETKELAEILASALLDTAPVEALIDRVAELRLILNRPRYCLDWEELLALGPTPDFEQLCFSLFQRRQYSQPEIHGHLQTDG